MAKPTYSELHDFVMNTPICDSHEHMQPPGMWLETRRNILAELTHHYFKADLISSGGPLMDDGCDAPSLLPGELDIEKQMVVVDAFWQKCRFTGYGEAIALAAREVYGIEEITAESLMAAQPKHEALFQPGEHLRLLRDVANLDSIQINNSPRDYPVEDPGFYLYDFDRGGHCSGYTFPVEDLDVYEADMEQEFEQYASQFVAVKSVHAYYRPLFWELRERAEVAAEFDRMREKPEVERFQPSDLIGDFALAKTAELCGKHHLPFKIHTGYWSGNSEMTTHGLGAQGLCKLFPRYPECPFVLMHISYPYEDELIAIAKHHPNVYIDMCWAWSIDPYSSMQFVRKAIYALPLNKVFLFGGDTFYPVAVVGFALQCRQWFYRALAAEVDDGCLTEAQAIKVAEHYMRKNQYERFDLERKKSDLRALAQTH